MCISIKENTYQEVAFIRSHISKKPLCAVFMQIISFKTPPQNTLHMQSK